MGKLRDQTVLWDEHFWLSRSVMVMLAYDVPCIQKDVDLLYKNQERIAKNFAKITGKSESISVLEPLLKEHVRLAIKIFTAYKQKKPYQDDYILWMQNADEIAREYDRLSDGRLKYQKMKDFMVKHNVNAFYTAKNIIDRKCDLPTVDTKDEFTNYIDKQLK